MGHRMEVYCEPEDADRILAKIEPYGIPAQVVGRTEGSASGNANRVTVQNLGETLEYTLEG
jgi:phosphoribosylformylglycinamidine cyclo-ligase